jgi:hypothetical protein
MLPQGGEIYVPAASSCYQFSVPILISIPVVLRGDGPATCLTYTGHGIAMTWTGRVFGSEMRDLTLNTTAAPGASVEGTTAVYLNQVANFNAHNVNIRGFATGLTFGSDTWLTSWYDGIFQYNKTAVDFPAGTANVGENMSFIHTTFADGTQSDGVSFGMNCVALNVTPGSNSSEFSFINTSFDGCQVVIGANWESSTRFVNPHFEDVQSSLSYPFLKITTGPDPTKGSNVVLTNPNFMLDSTQTLPEAFIELNNNSSLSIENAVAQGWGGISAPKAWIALKGSGTNKLNLGGTFHIVHNAGSIPVYLVDGINIPQVTSPRPSSIRSVPVASDGDVVLAEGHLSGDYLITWQDQSNRYQSMKVAIGDSYYSTSAAVNILSNYVYEGNAVMTNLRIVTANGTPQLVVNVSNRNGSDGPLTVQWNGDGVYRAQLFPRSPVGTTQITNYGLQQRADGSTAIVGGMKLEAGIQPACSSATGGMLWYVPGDVQVGDAVVICLKNAAGNYSWRSIALGESTQQNSNGQILRGSPVYPLGPQF